MKDAVGNELIFNDDGRVTLNLAGEGRTRAIGIIQHNKDGTKAYCKSSKKINRFRATNSWGINNGVYESLNSKDWLHVYTPCGENYWIQKFEAEKVKTYFYFKKGDEQEQGFEKQVFIPLPSFQLVTEAQSGSRI